LTAVAASRVSCLQIDSEIEIKSRPSCFALWNRRRRRRRRRRGKLH
jgi:hypothetical protein